MRYPLLVDVLLPSSFVEARTSADDPFGITLMSDASIEQARTWPGMPEYFIPFAGDGGGNYWCFDTRLRQGGEYPIEFWDHEEPDAHLVDGPPTTLGQTFSSWLEEKQHEERLRLRRASVQQRREALERRLRPHLPVGAPYTPNEDEVCTAEEKLQFSLPAQYRWFTGRFGSVDWPVRVEDALDLVKLQDGGDVLWFGGHAGRRFGFDERGAVVEESDGRRRVVAPSFFLWLDDEIVWREKDDARRAAIPSPRVIKRKRKS